MALNIVIMAAGKGTRMKSAAPKVLHKLAGRSLLAHVLGTAEQLQAQRTVVVVGHGAEQVEASAAGPGRQFVRQEPQLGTGHAVQQAVPALGHDDGTTLILNGDVPLIRAATARALIDACGGERLALLTIALPDPTGYGRILRDGQRVLGIVEHKDATPEQHALREVYTGMMSAPTAWLKRAVARLKNDNAQREYYLTDIVAMAAADGVPVVASQAVDETEVLGVNSPAQLAELERRVQRAQADTLMEAGVRLADPARFDLRGELVCGSDVEIDVNNVFEGRVELGDGVRIGPNCVIRDAKIGDDTEIFANCVIDSADIGGKCLIGPFSRVRPTSTLASGVHIGNFVEVKNSQVGAESKANHLSYVGDAEVGRRVNVGAGTIIANYDGANKHRTVIEDDAHTGSNSVLVAPITVGAGATVGAGSTVTRAVPAGKLTLARARQVVIDDWVRPIKQKK
ncbi:MAG TPA: bifunctional UDP-N-acetylglucosamine diphosphorylase/glucosamine-1-phosphate N-acetyltransferase GlmU [Burkholderiaceae bacterium]